MRFSILAALIGCASLAPASAQTLAFSANGTGETQNFSGSLGLFFNLSQSLTIVSLGYWDDHLDGVVSTVHVAIFDRNTALPILSQPFSGTDGVLFGNVDLDEDGDIGRSGQYRFVNLSVPVVLPAGQYALVAWGYDFFNQFMTGITTGPAVDVNTFGGVLSFVESRYDNSPGVLPTIFDHSYAQYTVGTFSTSAIPEPVSGGLTAGVTTLLAFLFSRRLRTRRARPA